jgi:hypothetical protein
MKQNEDENKEPKNNTIDVDITNDACVQCRTTLMK